MLKRIRELALDLFDRGASPSQSKFTVKDIWATALVAIGGAESYFAAAEKLAMRLIVLPAGTIALTLELLGGWWCLHVLSMKSAIPSMLVLSGAAGASHHQYAYGQAARHLSRSGLLLLLVLAPRSIASIAESIIPLSETLYVYVLDASGRPVRENANIRVRTRDGIDVTAFPGVADDDGFFIVKTTYPVTRSAKLVINACGTNFERPLSSHYEVTTDTGGAPLQKREHPTFRYLVECKEQP